MTLPALDVVPYPLMDGLTAVGMGSPWETLKRSSNTIPDGPAETGDPHDYFLLHLQDQDQLNILAHLGEKDPSLLLNLRVAVNQGRQEGFHLMPHIQTLLRQAADLSENIKNYCDKVGTNTPHLQDYFISTKDQLVKELLSIWSDQGARATSRQEMDNSVHFVHQTWGSLTRSLAELADMNGDSTMIDKLSGDPLYPTIFSPHEPLEYLEKTQDYPKSKTSHEILAQSLVIHGLYLQLKRGDTPQEMESALQAYYQSFHFDGTTTATYTDQEKLTTVVVSNLEKRLKESPLPQNAKICIVGCGADPGELKILAELAKKGLIPKGCVIDAIDMQDSASLGLAFTDEYNNALTQKAKDLGLNLAFHPSSELEGWAKQNPQKYNLVTLIGSVTNNDPNQLKWLSGFAALKKLLVNPGDASSNLIIDTANLEHLASQNTHYQNWLQYHRENAEAPPGSRESAHMKAYAQIYPAYFMNAIRSFLGFSNKETTTWDAGGKFRSLYIVENTKEVPPFAHLVLLLASAAYARHRQPQ